MSYKIHMKGYNDLRTLHQIDRLYAWKHDKYFPPAIVEISPTHKCNQRCRYCYADKGGERGEILGNDILINCFRQVAEAGVNAVLVQGTGEPLLHKGLPKAIEVGSKHKLSIGLTTNGVLLNESVQKKILHHLFYIRFSVLESDPKRYAYLHGCVEKQWEYLVSNIESTVNLRDRGGLNLALWATVYLYEENFRDAYNIVHFFKQLGIDYIVLQEATYTEFSPSGKGRMVSECFSETEIHAMKMRVMSLVDEDFCVKIRFPINDDTYYVGIDKELWRRNFCQGIKFYTIISSDGEVYPCWRFWGKKEYSYGSLATKSFEEIWKGNERTQLDHFVNNSIPTGDECLVCNITKLNDILNKCQDLTNWRDFLI
jgi:radical SAM protein with 4Fe4S-binding SPASM domain